MAARLREQATYEDILNAPDSVIAELIEGKLVTSPRPTIGHADAVSEVLSLLRSEFGPRGRGTWHILVEPELHLGADVLVPDIAAWRTDRVPELPRLASIAITPDWVCEALSRSSARYDRERKLPIYARHEIPFAWLLDFDLQYVEVKQLREGVWTDIGTYGGDATVRLAPFDEVEMNLSFVWGPPPS